MAGRGPSPPVERQGPERTGSPSAFGIVIIDDSLVVRRLVGRVIETDPGLQVLGEASDGQTGLDLVRALRPDAIVVDLEMPGMSGYAVLRALEAEQLGSQVVVFANVEPENRVQVEAAVRSVGGELVVKPTGVTDAEQALTSIRGCLLEPLHRRARQAKTPSLRTGARRAVNAVVIASSTGGPNALEAVLSTITDLRVPIFIVQHIADGFSGRLADRLDTVCSFPVREVGGGERVKPGHAYVGPGGIHLTVERDGDGPTLRLRDLPPVNSCRPSADVLFRSSAEVYGGNQLGVVLTGIGRDGLEGCRELASRGAPILVQDEKTSVVWGMPGAVAGEGLADEVLPIEDIASRLQLLTRTGVQDPTSSGSAR